MEKAWEISVHTFSSVWVLFPIRFPSCGIPIKWEMHDFPQQFPIAWENIAKTHPVSPQVVYPQHYIFYLF